jgi:hypothetical protein
MVWSRPLVLVLVAVLLAASLPSAIRAQASAPVGTQAETGIEAGAPADADVDARRAAIVSVARAYAEHPWIAGPENVLHGAADDGVHVDTPDAEHRPDGWHADGRTNVGVPYKWGGFDTLESFDEGVAEGRPAGELTDGVDLDASRLSLGVDCSGFVARCWGLPGKQSTRSLGRLSFELDDYGQLQAGDLINKFDAHAMLVVGLEDDGQQVRVIEATLPKVLENVYPVSRLEELGFRPYRYKPLDPRWVEVEAEGRIVANPFTTPGGRFESDGPWELLSGADDPLASALPGDQATWERSFVVDDETSTLTRTLASREGGLLVQGLTTFGNDRLQTQELHAARADLPERLLATSDEGQPFDELVLDLGRARSGAWVLPDGSSRPARQVELRWKGRLTARTNVIPIDVAIDAVLSPDVPLEGVVELERRTTWHLDGGSPTNIGRLRLTAAVRAPSPLREPAGSR